MKRKGSVRPGEVRRAKDAFLRETGGYRLLEGPGSPDFHQRYERIQELRSKIHCGKASAEEATELGYLLNPDWEGEERMKKD